jgi:hypothetical protein
MPKINAKSSSPRGLLPPVSHPLIIILSDIPMFNLLQGNKLKNIEKACQEGVPASHGY